MKSKESCIGEFVNMNRKYSIDVLRIISAIAVIVIHVISAPLVFGGTDDLSLAASLNLVHQLMKWCVPVFFMITGYCMLVKSQVTYKYCFSHVLKYVCVLFTVGLFYALLEEVFVAKSISVMAILRSVLNVISGNLWDHMWYVYAIIGIYLVIPVIHHFMMSGNKNVYTLTIILFLFNILLSTIEDWLPIGVTIPFGKYLFYVCFGGAVAKALIGKKLSFVVYLAGVLSVIWIFLDNGEREFGYSHLAVCFIAMSIFLLVCKMEVKPNKFLLCISQCAWGIYLIHPFFINIVVKLLEVDLLSSHAYIKLFLLAIIVAIVSFFATYILRKIPFVKKLF